MERTTASADGPAGDRIPASRTWLLGAALLLAWQGWLTLQLFGPYPLGNLLNDQPITSGTYPQNLYLGIKEAWAVVSEGRVSVYDSSFQAGYLNTPIFDGGRLAALLLLAGGGSPNPMAYKIGIAALCLLVPLLLILSGKTLGLSNCATLLATFLGQLVWWGPHGRSALQTGDCQLFLASLAGLAHVGLLVAFHRSPGVRTWFGLWMTAGLGWFLQPLLFPIALPMLLAYYLSVGVKHEFLTWHVALGTAEAIGFLMNLPWLLDWTDYWWLRASSPSTAGLLEHRTIATIWQAPLWGGPTDRLLAMIYLVTAAVGVLILNQTRQRPASRLLGIGAGGAIALALLGISWKPLGAAGTASFLAPSLWFACPAAAHAWTCLAGGFWRLGRFGRAAFAVLLAGAAAGFVYGTDSPLDLAERCWQTEPLTIGLNASQQDIIHVLTQYTSADARILWEDRDRPRQGSRWAALLPLLTQREFIGGLDPDGFVEHSAISLRNKTIAGDAFALWTDEKLMDYCRRYNIRWIVAWSPETIQKLEEWRDAKKIMQLHDDQPGWLFQVERIGSFALRGQADLLPSRGAEIVLGNVCPDHNGEVVISLHYQAGMTASPSRIKLEKFTSGDDQIGFIRLRLASPADRVYLSWER